MKKIGLIAGNRKFPLIFAEAARKNDYQVVAVAIKGDTSSRLSRLVDKIYWLKLGDFREMFDIFKKEGVVQIVMAGQVSPHRLFSRDVVENGDIKKLLASIKDKKADTIFGAVAGELKEAGLELIDSTTFIKDFLPAKATLTKREPDFKQWEDIYFGLELAKQIAYLDIGQTVAVKDKAVVAVEALEGTDNLIKRAGKISRGGATIVKVSKPKQDMRFDIPVVGINTIKNIIKSKVSCLAIEADKTLFIDKQESIRLADKKGISVVVV